MGAQDLTALSLILSVGASGVGWMAASLIERLSDDPRLRDRVWGGALGLSVLPVLAIAVLLLTPAPVREVAVAAVPFTAIESASASAPSTTFDRPAWPAPGVLVWIVLAASGVLGLIRLVALALRTLRLARLIGHAVPADAKLRTQIDRIAARLEVTPPPAVISDASRDALLAGLGAPRLILPASVQPADAVIAHELAHLKRGDHRTLWLEEAIAAILAFNPLIPVLRARRDAAREEACDALALTGAGSDARRAYAQTLIQALRDRAGSQGARGPRVALTFTGAGRTTAMKRLNAVMTPAAPAGRRTRFLTLSLALTAGLGAAGATAALAGQREVDVRVVTLSQASAPARTAASRAAASATLAAIDALPPQTAARFQRASASDYKAFCGSADPADEGFCAGVLFAHLADAPQNGLCLPEGLGNDSAGMSGLVTRGKAEVARLTPRNDEGAYEYAARALASAFPCGEAAFVADGVQMLDGPQPTAGIPDGGGRLWLSLQADGIAPRAGDLLVVQLAGESAAGVRYESRNEFSIGPDGALPNTVFFDLAPDYFPSGSERRAYQLKAEIRRGDEAVYASQPADIRLAPGSQGSLSRLRPILNLEPL